jgi:phosphoribosylglycinamide formyltransferase 1
MTRATVNGSAAVNNLLAALNDPRFEQRSIHHAIEAFDREGVRIERFTHTPDDVLAWIDAEFGGTWSSEAFAGGTCVARTAAGPIGFAAFDSRGLRFGWLRSWRKRPDVGIFGPLGVARPMRGRGVGELLLRFALFSLRERGYAYGLIPVVRGDKLRRFYERHAGARAVEAVDFSKVGRSRAVVLASGNGSNFQAVVDATRGTERPLPIEVVGLVANRRSAFAVERAAQAGVPAQVLVWDRATARATYDETLMNALEDLRPDLVLLLGWMHVLPPAFVERFPNALNLHPAFLPLDPQRDEVTMPDGSSMPAFRGAHAVDDAFALGVQWGGASVHRLGAAVDRGEILARAPLRIEPGEPKHAFVERLHALEHSVLATAIRRWCYEEADSMTHGEYGRPCASG